MKLLFLYLMLFRRLISELFMEMKHLYHYRAIELRSSICITQKQTSSTFLKSIFLELFIKILIAKGITQKQRRRKGTFLEFFL